MRVGGKKEIIEQTAIRLFATKGPAGTTIKDIAMESGVTDGALYRHYSSKESMAAELFVREMLKVREKLVAIVEGDLPFETKLRTLIDCLYRMYDEEPYSLLYVVLNFQNMQGIDLPGETGNIYDFITERTAQLFTEAGLAYDEITPILFAGLVLEPIFFHHYGRLQSPPSAYAGQVAGACRKLFGGAA